MTYVAGLIALGLVIACAYFLYSVQYPKPGTRPSFLKVILQVPVGIVLLLSALTSCSAFFDKAY